MDGILKWIAHDNPPYFGTVCGTSVGENNQGLYTIS